MSGIAALVARGAGAPPDEETLRRVLRRMPARGADDVELRRAGERALLGAARHAWERAEGFTGAAAVAVDGRVTVACDASLYYRGDLARAIAARGVTPQGTAPAQLIAAAYRAWGDDLVAHLEGDYAFVLWDEARRRFLAARDFVGSRPLHYAALPGQLVAASTPAGVLAHPAVDGAYNLAALGAAAAGFFGAAGQTVYAHVSALPAGSLVSVGEHDATPVVRAWWTPPVFTEHGSGNVSFADATAELRDRLRWAVAERFDTAAPTTISLSGGWDSPAVFGIGQAVLRDRGAPPETLSPVSMSFPVGDTGRENELIEDILGHWRVAPTWIDVAGLPMLADAAGRAGRRDEPFGHPFTSTNVALAQAGRRLGGRVMLNGVGGDQLFYAEPSYAADLVRRGDLAGALRALDGAGPRQAALREYVLRPLLGPAALRALGRLRGGVAPRGYLAPSLPTWIRGDFARREALVERERRALPRHPGESIAAYERRWILAHPFYPRVTQELCDLSLAEGVEQRAPLLDARVLDLAATRPRAERRDGPESKRLLRAAVRGLLPDTVLATRPTKTGTMADYFARGVRRELPPIAAPLFKRPILAELGIVDAAALTAAGARAERGQAEAHTGPLVFTLQTELWLRARAAGDGA